MLNKFMNYMKSNTLISIIVPVYNLEHRNLTRCIDSILSQTYSNFELIIVNDGSTDKSMNICESYMQRDKRIKLINKQNGGVSSARNMGIEHSKGEYICFIDGDDYIDNDYLEHFTLLLPTDLILQSVADFCYDYDKAKTQYHFQTKNYGDDFYELFKKYDLYHFGAPWARLFKTDIIKTHKLKFDQLLHYREDELFFLSYLRFVHSVKTDAYYGYHYMYYPNSATNRYYGFDHDYKSAFDIYTTSYQLGKERQFNIDYFSKIFSLCLNSLFSALSNSYKNNHLPFSQRINNIRMIKNFVIEEKKSFEIPQKQKLLLFPVLIIDFIFYWRTIIKNKISISI